MSDWNGEERRKNQQDLSRDIQRLTQSIEENIAPLLRKHDHCLYGERGDNGIVSVISDVKKYMATAWRLPVLLVSVLGVLMAFVEYLKK
jgi:hypothetical protein